MRCPRCQAKNPDNPRFYHHCDQLDDALSEYKEAVRLDPFHSRALLQTSPRQSWAWAWSGFPGEISEPHFEQARVSRTPPSSQKLAATHENVGRYRAAIARWSPLTARRRS
jgi:hypothetical protein